MRKSERIRLLELEVTRLSIEMQYLTSIINALLEKTESVDLSPDLDAGKWYSRKPNRND